MSKVATLLVALLAIFGGLIFAIHYKLTQVPDRPQIDIQRWWGSGSKAEKDDVTIRPFKIDFNDTMIQDLKQRLNNRRRFTPSLEGTQSQYGMNSEYLQEVLNYWASKYDFKKRAELLNRFPHYKTKIQGLDIHFIRVKPEVKKGVEILPLLMLHGWPSSSKEFDKVIPLLTTPRKEFKFVFEVIAADLPGFGFSQGTNKPGLSPVQMSVIMRNLMLRLGFQKYYVQAGDWGSQVASHMITLFPENALGYHTNMPISSRPISTIKMFIGSLFPHLIDSDHPERIYPLKNYFKYVIRESGYFHIQATKPDTIGAALTDSPAGLASYVMEKIAVVSDKNQLDTPHGGLDNLNRDDVLDMVTIIWVNECIVTSMRIYAEGLAWPEVDIVHDIPTEVPTAAVKFLHEVVYQPDLLLKDKYLNLVRSTSFDFGGHFPGLHTPEEFVQDIFESVAAFINFRNRKNIKQSHSLV